MKEVEITNILFSVISGEQQVMPSFSASWFWQVCYTIASLFGFWFVIEGVKHMDASIAALTGLVEIVFSILFGIIIFGEPLTLTVAVGGLCIVVSAVLPNLNFKRSTVS